MGNRMRAAKAYNGVECYVGMPGSGKTYALVERGVHALRSGRRVFCNAGFAIHDPKSGRSSEPYYSLEELLTVPNGSTVLVDEAPVFVNSRKGDDFPRGLLYRLTQVRKDGLQLCYSAMDEMMVDKNFRRVTFMTWHCRRWMFGIFRRHAMAPIDRRRPDSKVISSKWLFGLRRDVAGAYDTLSKVYIPPEVIDALLDDTIRPWLPLTNEIADALVAGRALVHAEGEKRSLAMLQTFLEDARRRAAVGAGGPDAKRGPQAPRYVDQFVDELLAGEKR